MDPDRGHVTHREEAKDFITHSNNGSRRMGIPMAGSLKPIPHRANWKRSSGTCTHSEFH